MAKPTKHHGKWRTRWFDENGERQSESYVDHRTADYWQKKRETEVAEIKAGLRQAHPKEKLFPELCTYWIENRLPHKRNQKDDLSIINAHLLPAFGKIKLQHLSVDCPPYLYYLLLTIMLAFKLL